jgi:hypothetical protein
LLTFVINLRIQFKRSRRWAKLVMLMGTYQWPLINYREFGGIWCATTLSGMPGILSN